MCFRWGSGAVAHMFCAIQPQARRQHSLGGNPAWWKKGRRCEGWRSGKWEEKWRIGRKKEKRAKIVYMEMGKGSKDRDNEVERKNVGCQKNRDKAFFCRIGVRAKVTRDSRQGELLDLWETDSSQLGGWTVQPGILPGLCPGWRGWDSAKVEVEVGVEVGLGLVRVGRRSREIW